MRQLLLLQGDALDESVDLRLLGLPQVHESGVIGGLPRSSRPEVLLEGLEQLLQDAVDLLAPRRAPIRDRGVQGHRRKRPLARAAEQRFLRRREELLQQLVVLDGAEHAHLLRRQRLQRLGDLRGDVHEARHAGGGVDRLLLLRDLLSFCGVVAGVGAVVVRAQHDQRMGERMDALEQLFLVLDEFRGLVLPDLPRLLERARLFCELVLQAGQLHLQLGLALCARLHEGHQLLIAVRQRLDGRLRLGDRRLAPRLGLGVDLEIFGQVRLHLGLDLLQEVGHILNDRSALRGSGGLLPR
mmetsp:Transcript_53423/g.155426  ORF Transcript_53423/g.155426 Transcript_53423/m.155426 type:complete len:298 (-) Transcript_53423:1992-2885(-)